MHPSKSTKTALRFALLLLLQCMLWESAFAHPPAGLVVDDRGRVYFLDHGLVRIESNGALTTIQESSGGHWLARDVSGKHTEPTQGPYNRVSVDGNVLFFGDGAPLAMSPDGALFYATSGSREEGFPAGALALARLAAGGEKSLFSPQLRDELAKHQDGITAVAMDRDGSLYVGTWKGIFKLNPDGSIARSLYPLAVPDCDSDPADHKAENASSPLFRGLGVDVDGNIYAAATSCHRVLRIAPNGETRTVLKSERPWSPTGIAVHGKDVYVLEFTNANGPRTEGWYPRVQRRDRAGKWKVLAAIGPPVANRPTE